MTAPDRRASARAISGNTEGTYDVEIVVREIPVVHVDLNLGRTRIDSRPPEESIARGRALVGGADAALFAWITQDPRRHALYPVVTGKAAEFRLVEIDALGGHRGLVAEIYVATHSRSAVALWDRCYGAAIGLHRPAAPWYATRLCRGPDPWVAELARALAWAVIER